jgi:hypothetical protein
MYNLSGSMGFGGIQLSVASVELGVLHTHLTIGFTFVYTAYSFSLGYY